LTGADDFPGAADVVTLGLHVNFGGVLSVTETEKEQLAPPPSEQVTMVTPTGKKPPDGGAQVIAPHAPNAPGSE
jgi:hypothetical protein